MQIETLVVGPLQTNCYIISKNNKCLIVDPGDEFNKIKQTIQHKQVIGCLLTHNHFDHIGALEETLKYYNLEVNTMRENIFDIKIIPTPGHTQDSITFYFEKEKIMFTGDFIFKYGIGRTDLGGSDSDMFKSLELITNYPDDILCYPGHGEPFYLGTKKGHFNL